MALCQQPDGSLRAEMIRNLGPAAGWNQMQPSRTQIGDHHEIDQNDGHAVRAALVGQPRVNAQTETQPLPERCKVDPRSAGRCEGQPADPSTTENLTDKLDDCMLFSRRRRWATARSSPASHVGTMPVIRPDEVPPQDGSVPQ